MAEFIGIASGLASLVVSTLQSSQKLHQALKSFQTHQRTIRELKQEVEALIGVLQALQETINKTNLDLSALQIPLSRCGTACLEFEKVIAKSTTHSGGTKTSIRDWTRFKYMGDDITGFKNALAGYKSTIAIALGDANIRTATVTADLLDQYKEMIQDTSADLEERLQEIDVKLNRLVSRTVEFSDNEEVEQQQMEAERESIQKCLDICMEVSEHLEEAQSKHLRDISTQSNTDQRSTSSSNGMRARQMTSQTIQNCRTDLTSTRSQLQLQLSKINEQLQSLSQQDNLGKSESETQNIRDELESVRKCLDICAEAGEQLTEDRVNVFEDVSMSDDGHQIIISTFGDLISAKHITIGARSDQWLGQFSNTSLQQLSKDRSRHMRERDRSVEIAEGTRLEGQHGRGRKLN